MLGLPKSEFYLPKNNAILVLARIQEQIWTVKYAF